MKKIAVLSLSGGMDSTALMLHLIKEGYDVRTLSFDYGQKHKREIDCVKDNIAYLKLNGINVEHNVVDLSILGKLFNSALTSADIEVPTGHYAQDNMKKTVVPNRNAIFSAIVYGYALSLSEQFNTDAVICLGIHSGDHAIYPDCRQEFRDAIEHAFKIGNWGSERVSYYTPYIDGDKFTILQDGQKACEALRLDFIGIFYHTNTCYNPNTKGEACGKCGSCVERILAFNKLGTPDPAPYCTSWENVVENANQLEKEHQETK